MKNLLILIFLCSAFYSSASTDITTSSVSGHWTLSGSPYLVHNDISIAGTSSLIIDPGVSVLFQGPYNLYVSGILYAAGTELQPITFNVSDTSGWWNSSTSNGGWHGITFQPFTGTGADTSLLQYCNISYTKFDSADAMSSPMMTTLYVQRSLTLNNCNFSNNKSAYDYLLYVLTAPLEAFNMGNCTFTSNSFARPVIFIDNFAGGTSHLFGNKISQNHSDFVILLGAAVNLLFENNEIYDNTSVNGTILFVGTTSSMVTKDCHATIRSNKIHDNVNTFDAALVCFSGFRDINATLVCNNQHTSGLCGARDGGGGINIMYNSPGSYDSTFYTVRNNVIANNYSPFHGGGISIDDAQCLIANNQVVNNTSAIGGGLYMYTNFPSAFKNNVFYGNITSSDTSSLNAPDISGTSTTTVEYDHNWSQHSSLFGVDLGSFFTFSGDTTTNIMGTNPQMVAPTITAAVTESALTADFSLLYTSTCINAGDSTGADTYITDFAGNTRIVSGILDIGAFEFNPTTLLAPSIIHSAAAISVFPNPASSSLLLSAPYIITDVTITNLMGQLVMALSNTEATMELNVSRLTSGVYFLKINRQEVRQFVKD